MRMPGFTAHSSLYRTSTSYRTIGNSGQNDGAVFPSQLTPQQNACMDRCMDGCVKAGIMDSPPDVPIGLIREECRPICLIECGALPAPCPPDTKFCGRTGNRPECCPTSHECCHVLDHTGTRYILSCCPPGQKCCFPFGCYTPGEYQCTRDGLCPTDRVICQDHCCGPGEICTQDGCCSANRVCDNRCCGLLDRCTPQGCCSRDRYCNGVCCEPGARCCNGACCEPGESCTHEGCCPQGVCCESTPCPPGRSCCGGVVCCEPGAECKQVHGTSVKSCFVAPPS